MISLNSYNIVPDNATVSIYCSVDRHIPVPNPIPQIYLSRSQPSIVYSLIIIIPIPKTTNNTADTAATVLAHSRSGMISINQGVS